MILGWVPYLVVSQILKKWFIKILPTTCAGTSPNQPTNQSTTSFEKRTFGTLQLAASNLAGRQYLRNLFEVDHPDGK